MSRVIPAVYLNNVTGCNFVNNFVGQNWSQGNEPSHKSRLCESDQGRRHQERHCLLLTTNSIQYIQYSIPQIYMAYNPLKVYIHPVWYSKSQLNQTHWWLAVSQPKAILGLYIHISRDGYSQIVASWDLLSILGNSNIRVPAQVIPGESWDHSSILGFLGYWDIGIFAQVVPGTSWDCPSILGILGYSDRGVGGPRSILGLSEFFQES